MILRAEFCFGGAAAALCLTWKATGKAQPVGNPSILRLNGLSVKEIAL
jgi:hypothetical protein